MAFFLNSEDQARHERENPVKVKRSYNKQSKNFQITGESDPTLNKHSFLKQPSHFDKLLASRAGKLISSVSHFTEGGILLACIYELETGQFEVKHWDVNFNVTYQEVFNTLDECEQSFDKYREGEGWFQKWGQQLPDSGLLQCIKDVWKRTGQITNEHYFLFRLLTNPDERRKYEIDGIIEETNDPLVQVKAYNPSPKVNYNPVKLKGLDLLSKKGK